MWSVKITGLFVKHSARNSFNELITKCKERVESAENLGLGAKRYERLCLIIYILRGI